MNRFAINTSNPHQVVMEAELFARQVDQSGPMAQLAIAACWTDQVHPMGWSNSRGMENWRAKIVSAILEDLLLQMVPS